MQQKGNLYMQRYSFLSRKKLDKKVVLFFLLFLVITLSSFVVESYLAGSIPLSCFCVEYYNEETQAEDNYCSLAAR